MPTTLTLDLFLDTSGPMAPCRLLQSVNSTQTVGTVSLVQADKLTVRLWLVSPATTLGAAATTLTHTGSIALAIKADQSDTDLLALCTEFTVATVGGLTCYTGTLNLNTTEMATAFTSPALDSLAAWFDIELSNATNRQTFQNRVTINREVYNGTQPPPEAVPEWPAPADIPNKPSADGYGRIVVKDGADGLLKLSKLAFNLLSPGVVELASNTAGTLSISEPTLNIGAATGSSSTSAMSIGNAACHTDMLGEFDFTAATTNSLVRYDIAQTLTAPQQAQARANIGVVTSGGVGLAGDDGGVGGNGAASPIPAQTDFEIHTVVIPRWTSATSGCSAVLYASDGSTVCGIALGAGANGANLSSTPCQLYSAYGVSRYTLPGFMADYVGKPMHVGLSVSSGVAHYYINGAAVGTTMSGIGAVTISRIFGGVSGYGQIAGDSCRLAFFNRALTSDERAAVMRGEVPAALAKSAVTFTPTGWTEFDGDNLISIAANTITKSAGAPSAALSTAARTNAVASVKVGEVWRVKATVTITSGSASSLPAIVLGDYNTLVEARQLLAGANSFDITIPAGASETTQYLSLNWHSNYSLNDSGAVTFSIVATAERIGTVARYEPENVTSLGRWLDSSGNGYDLLPGSGITPLKPQHPRPRSELLRLNADGSYLRSGDICGIGLPVRFTAGGWALGAHWAESQITQFCTATNSVYTHAATSSPQGNAQYIYSVNIANGNTENYGNISVHRSWTE